jgi:autotransporter translocation and assembly factor TamB
VLDVLLVYEFETVVVSIIVTGTPDKPDVRFESSPATYDQAALLGIVLGADPDESETGDIANQATGAAASYLVGAIRSGLGQSLWLDTLGVELDEKYDPSVQLGKWITRELFIGYEHDFGANEVENTSEAIVRYRFLPGWMVESRIGDKAQGIDLFWTQRF